MRERVRQLSGELSVRSDSTGTMISCVLSHQKILSASIGNAS